MTNVEKLKELRPDVVEQFEALDKDQLLEACCGEHLDFLSHEDRVQIFMNECTNMSKTNYTLGVIETLIAEHKEQLIDEDMWSLIESDLSDEEIVKYVNERAEKLVNK
jgi:hypothetical protein